MNSQCAMKIFILPWKCIRVFEIASSSPSSVYIVLSCRLHCRPGGITYDKNLKISGYNLWVLILIFVLQTLKRCKKTKSNFLFSCTKHRQIRNSISHNFDQLPPRVNNCGHFTCHFFHVIKRGQAFYWPPTHLYLYRSSCPHSFWMLPHQNMIKSNLLHN